MIDHKPEICPKCQGTEFWSVEYAYDSPQRYDGISEYACQTEGCGYRVGRWTGFELHDGECEPRLGQIRTRVGGNKFKMIDAGAPVKVTA